MNLEARAHSDVQRMNERADDVHSLWAAAADHPRLASNWASERPLPWVVLTHGDHDAGFRARILPGARPRFLLESIYGRESFDTRSDFASPLMLPCAGCQRVANHNPTLLLRLAIESLVTVRKSGRVYYSPMP